MFKLLASIQKDFRLLSRDKVGLLLMFLMPIVLAILIAAIQNNTFKLVNENKINLLIVNKDSASISRQFLAAIKASGMFNITEKQVENEKDVLEEMDRNDALAALVIPASFSSDLSVKSKGLSQLIFKDLGLSQDSVSSSHTNSAKLSVYYSPVLQESFRQSITAALRGAQQGIENKQLLRALYAQVDAKKSPAQLEQTLLQDQNPLQEITAASNGSRIIPNATQHNIPAWTIFAMFFIVISLGSSVVKEKLNGSFVRLKTLPTNFMVSLTSKQITYLSVTLLQVIVIFTLGVYLFPAMGLPRLNLPDNLAALLFISFICGWCAVSYSIAIGVFANTQEQANGFGAVTIVIFAAIGGLLVPSFVMPAALYPAMNLSPLHWCLEAYYALFLKNATFANILLNSIPLLVTILLLQGISLAGLKRKNLI